MDDSTAPNNLRDAGPAAPNPVDEALGMEARIMVKGLNRPERDPLPDDLKRQIRQIAKEHLKKTRLPQSALAHQIGLRGDSAIGEVLAGKYRAEDSALLRKINAWLEDDERRRRREEPLGIYDTNVLTSIRDAAAIAKKYARTAPDKSIHDERPRIVMAKGPSGIGKTAGAIALAATDPNSILIRVVEGRGSAPGVARLIAKAIGLRDMPRHTGSIIDQIIERLTNCGRLLIVDEAHGMVRTGFNLLRDLSDVCGIPILLLGTARMQRRVVQPRMGLGNFMDEQFSRRVAYVVDLLKGSDGKGGSKRPFFSEAEIIAIFKRDNLRLTDDAVDYLQAVACTVAIGMLGQAVNIFEKARTVARRGNGLVDSRILRAAAEKVLMAPGDRNEEILRQIDAQSARNRELAASAARAAAAG